MFGNPFYGVRRILWPLILICGLALLGAGSSAQAKLMQINGKMYDIAQPGEFVPGEVVVKANPGYGASDIAVLAPHINAQIKKSIPEYRLHLLAFPAAADAAARKIQMEEAILTLKAFPQVANAFPNYKVSIPKPVTPKMPALGVLLAPAPQLQPAPFSPPVSITPLKDWQWHLYRSKRPFRQPRPVTPGPPRAVLDSGVDASHPALAGRVLPGYDFILDLPGGDIDGNGHGTHVAGIAAASGGASGIMGISPSSHILPVRVLDNAGNGSIFAIMQGVTYASKNQNVKILNLSLSAYMREDSAPDSPYQIYKKVYDDAVNIYGKLVVAAASNEDNIPMYRDKTRPVPAYFPSCLTVAASNDVDCRAEFSNYNASFGPPYNYDFNFVKIVAPGVNILSSYPDGQYKIDNGTSMAAPVVAGCAAQVWAANPGFTNLQVQNRLLATAAPLPAGSGFPAYPGAQKRVDLGRALGGKKTGLCGVVYDGGVGRPLAGVKVKATTTQGVTGQATTNQAGFFTLAGLAPGKAYNLTFTKTGFCSFDYTAAYGPVTTAAGTIGDLLMPVYLSQARPAGQWSVMITYHSFDPGLEDAKQTQKGQPIWMPVNWNQTDGTNFSSRVYLNGAVVLNPVKRGDLPQNGYALTQTPADFNRPCTNIVINPKGADTFLVAGYLNNTNDIVKNDLDEVIQLYDWGNYLGANVNATAFIYNGSTLRQTVRAAAATGTGPCWKIASITGGTLSVINEFDTLP